MFKIPASNKEILGRKMQYFLRHDPPVLLLDYSEVKTVRELW
jgi:hypothetical protein